ncbi:ferrous iron transport protein B [Clostridium acetireducens DSM 10703]|jgi:ferrous iron transport protein B|uniref:Ferrous iron transport protein B n=1 Tax=Clostridium acetireducens DSM 10703 TaxID=1121290 RepID=A0A1E8F0U3_9CLOT|nr:ferrous iron transport protein B [Clostridium acetireducens]OFI06785.1 ferrous iron transport protein B [Clostridium acetireducens DSM 10703]
MEKVIALVGNPNCGKTSLFNALTGAKQHVGNWAGVTVEKKEGKLNFNGEEITVVDLPGTYSLGAYSEDEKVARDFILKDKPSVIINVVDSTNIERNLYLTTQLLEMNANVVLAANMLDEAKNKNIDINIKELSKKLGVKILGTVATKGEGIKELIEETVKEAELKEKGKRELNYGEDFYKYAKEIKLLLLQNNINIGYPLEWTAIKLLENDEDIIEEVGKREKGENVIHYLKSIQENIEKELAMDSETLVVDKRYEFISNITDECVKREEEYKENISDKIDKVVTNRWLGIPLFAIIMFFMYQITMQFGNEYLGGFVADGFESLGESLEAYLTANGAPELLISFVSDGLIGGMGSVLEFVPLIFVMYFLISILEDSGYMARAAYVMDRFMTSIGLHGKTAISMIIGSGCNVAGVMSTRTLESKKDRMIAILINPFISCTAKLPVYALFAAAFFGGKKVGPFSSSGIVIFSLYVLGILVAIIMGKIFSKTLFKGENSYFVMELPPYRIPTAKSVFIHMWEKAGAFLKKAGTIIFGVVVAVWILSNIPFGVEPASEYSVLGRIGGFIAPIFKPAGFGTWQAGVSLFTGILAKETIIATLGSVYAAGEGAQLTQSIQQIFTPLSAYAFMVISLLYTPCAATIGTIKRETNSGKWALFVAAYTFAVGWLVAVLVYQVGRLMGLN